MAEARTYEGNGNIVTIADPENITGDECMFLARCGHVAWNMWRKQYPVWTHGTNAIRNSADFSNQRIDSSIYSFAEFEFGNGASFARADFPGGVSFYSATFGDHADFEGACFEGDANFSRAQFGVWACFKNSLFGVHTSFGGAQFGYHAIFESASFRGSASFFGAQFGNLANFEKTHFSQDASFSGLTWEGQTHGYGEKLIQKKELALRYGISPEEFSEISWRLARFDGEVSFSNRTFTGKTDFSNTNFAVTPDFHGCKLHQDTSFDRATFPSPTAKDHHSAGRAYRTLKLAFAQQQAIREEQRFFKLEMLEEGALETGWRRWLFHAYRELSDFGFSIVRPIIVFFLTTVVATSIYAWQAGLVFDKASTHTAVLVHFSLASAIPGLEKLAEPAALCLFGEVSKGITNYSLPTVLTLLAHKAISLLSLFLIGLALRNLFKMK